MLLIALSIFGVLSAISSVLVVSALMLSSRKSASEPWEEFYAIRPQTEPVPIAIQRAELS